MMSTVMYLMALAVTGTQAALVLEENQVGTLVFEREVEDKPGKANDADPQCKADEELVDYSVLLVQAEIFRAILIQPYPEGDHPAQICVPKKPDQKCQREQNANENGLRGQENGPKPCETPICGPGSLLVFPPGLCCGLCVTDLP